MTNEQAPPASLTLTAALSPADATQARDHAVEAINSAKAAGATLSVRMDGEHISPCALQILVGAQRSAEVQAVELAFTPQIDGILSSIDLN